MSFPSGVLSDLPVPATLVFPDWVPRRDRKVDWEIGGWDISDATQGGNIRGWKCYTDGTDVWIETIEEPFFRYKWYTGSGITEVTFSFDQLMHPVVAFVEGGLLKMRWYDSLLGGYTVTTYPGCTFPWLSRDDKRTLQSGVSDVLLFYVKGTSAYYLQQRERYGVERVLVDTTDPETKTLILGMSEGWRVQCDLESYVTAAYTDLTTGNAYVSNPIGQVSSPGKGGFVPGRWRSRQYEFAHQPSFAAARVIASRYPAIFRTVLDGEVNYETFVFNEEPFRLPSVRARNWQFEIETPYRVVEVALSDSLEEMEAEDVTV